MARTQIPENLSRTLTREYRRMLVKVSQIQLRKKIMTIRKHSMITVLVSAISMSFACVCTCVAQSSPSPTLERLRQSGTTDQVFKTPTNINAPISQPVPVAAPPSAPVVTRSSDTVHTSSGTAVNVSSGSATTGGSAPATGSGSGSQKPDKNDKKHDVGTGGGK